MIKKFSIFILLFSVALCTSCTKENTENEKDNQNILEEYSDIDILNFILDNLKTKNDYYILTTGKTSSKLGIISYNQNTETSIYFQNNEFYNIINSTSSLVSHHHKLYLNGDLVKYVDSDKTSFGVIETTKNDYINEYGKVPSLEFLFNYVINSDTILNSTKDTSADGYLITYYLDPVTSVVMMTKQMKIFGGLVEDPKFTKVSLTIYFDQDFNILKYHSNETYTIVKKIINNQTMECHQELSSVIYYKDYKKPELINFFD